MIIDVHSHMGIDHCFDEHETEEMLVNKHEKYGIDISIVQPGATYYSDEMKAQHTAIAELCKKYPGHFYGMANPNPHLRYEAYADELKRCVEELGFIGVKLHPTANGINPCGRDAQKVFELASLYRLPVMIHTGTGAPYAGPINAMRIAQKYPELTIVMAHCGMLHLLNEVIAGMNTCSNLYADLSWTFGPQFTREIGVERFMFATDLSYNAGTELAKIRTSGLLEEEQEWIFYKTALKVYHLDAV